MQITNAPVRTPRPNFAGLRPILLFVSAMAIVVWLLAAPAHVMTAEEVLAATRAEYAGKSYHAQSVTHHQLADTTTETQYSPTQGIKVVEKTPAMVDYGIGTRTITYWGRPECATSYWEEGRSRVLCTDLCAVGPELSLHILCDFSLGRPLLLPVGVERTLRLERRPLNGTDVYVVTDVTDSSNPSELWIDPDSFQVRRFVQVRIGHATTVDFNVVELGLPISAEAVTFHAPFTIDRFSREHGPTTLVLFVAVVFLASTALWILRYRLGAITAEEGAASRRKYWRWWLIAAGIGYALVLVLAIALMPVKGGHPPAIVLAIIAAYLWTQTLVIAATILVAAHVSAALLQRWEARAA